MIEPHRYYEDLAIGESHVSSSRQVSEAEIIEFASRYDPQYFHADPDTAGAHPVFGGVVASGIHILAIWRQLDHLITGDVHWICGIDWQNLRWNRPMRAGDEVRASAELLSKRPSASRPYAGIVQYRYALLNQNDEELFYCVSNNLVERRPDSNA